MSRKARPDEVIRRALEGELLPLGEYSFRDDNGGLRVTYPKTAERLNSVSQGDKAEVFVDQSTGATVIIPSNDE